MKKFLALAVAVLMLVALMSVTTSATRGFTYNSVYGTPTVDGVKEDLWNACASCNVKFLENDDMLINAINDPERVQAALNPVPEVYFSVMNDDQYIYFLAEVKDWTPGEDDLFELHFDEDYCQLSKQQCQQWPEHMCPVAYQLRVPIGDPDNFTYGNGVMGANTVDKDIILDAKVTLTPGSDASGNYEYRVMELKMQPVSTFVPGETVWGIECSFEDHDADGHWIAFYRWNMDSCKREDVAEGYPADVWDEIDGVGQWPYECTIVYAPFYFAAAPAGDDAPATEAPATEAPVDEPATEAPATEAPATEAPATEAPATEANGGAEQGGNAQQGGNNVPKTADVGIVVAAVVMAAAAAVVLNKKH